METGQNPWLAKDKHRARRQSGLMANRLNINTRKPFSLRPVRKRGRRSRSPIEPAYTNLEIRQIRNSAAAILASNPGESLQLLLITKTHCALSTRENRLLNQAKRRLPFRLRLTRLFQRETANLKDIAISLIEQHPRESFIIFTICRNHHAEDPEIDRHISSLTEKLKATMKLQRQVLSARSDGLTARINCICNGYALARHYDLPFNFSWPVDRVKDNPDLCIREKDIGFISDDFLSNYYLNEETIKSNSPPFHDKAKNNPVHGISLSSVIPKKEVQSLLSQDANIIPTPTLKHIHQIDPSFFFDFFSSFYSPSVHAEFNQIRDLRNWSDYIGIHYRGGDVIYGQARHGMHIRGKSLALPIVEHLIRNNPDRKVVLFGTPANETLDDLRYLAKKHPTIELSFNILDNSYQQKELATLYDVFIMSICSMVFSARSSHMVQLAFKMSGVRIITPPKGSEMSWLSDSIESRDFHERYKPRQISFVYLNLFILSLLEEDGEKSDLNHYLENAKRFDPENEAIQYFEYYLKNVFGRSGSPDRLLSKCSLDESETVDHLKKILPKSILRQKTD